MRIRDRLRKLEGPSSGREIMCLISPSKQTIRRVKEKHSDDELILYIANIKRAETQ